MADQLNNPRLPQRWNKTLYWRRWRRNLWKRKRQKRIHKYIHDINNKEQRPIWSNVNVVTHNVKGCSGKQSCKLDHIANMINKQDTPTIYLIQET